MSKKTTISDFKDLRKAIEEVTKNKPAQTQYEIQAEKMGYMLEAADEKDDAKDSGLKKRKDHAGEEEIKKAYLNLGTEAQGSVEYQRGLIQKELAKMGYKTYSKFAFDSIFKFENNSMSLKEVSIGESAFDDMKDIVKTKGAKKVGGIMVDMFTASVITQAYDKVNDANKKKMEKANVQTLVKLAQKVMSMKEELKLDEGKMSDLLIDIQQGATAKELARDFKIPLSVAKGFLQDYYGQKKGGRKEDVDEGKYTAYSDLLIMKAKIIDKEGPKSNKLPAVDNAIKIALKKLGIKEETFEEALKEANNKTAFFNRVKDRFPYKPEFSRRAWPGDYWERIAKVVKPKNVINSKRFVELGKIFDTGNIGKLQTALRDMEKKDGIEESVNESNWGFVFYNKKSLDNFLKDPYIKSVTKNVTIDKAKFRGGKSGFDVGIESDADLGLNPLAKKVDAIKKKYGKPGVDYAHVEHDGESISEGTWLLPKGPKAQKDLKALLKKPIPLGKDGDSATDVIDTFIGDDSLLDDLHSAGKKNPNADARPIIKKAMKRLGIKEEVSKEERLKEEQAHAKQSPFKLKSQQYPRAIAVDTKGYGKRHAVIKDITEACDSFGMITDQELQIEQIQKQLGKQGFISYTKSDLQDVFEDRETQRMIYALESLTEEQKPIEYTKDQVEDSYIMSEEIEFVKPDGHKTAGPILKVCENTFNVKDKYTGKSFTYKFINEGNKVKTFREITEAKFSAKLIKQAGGIAFDKRYVAGNYSGAEKAIEKLKKGLSDDPKVRELLRIANESFNNKFFETLTKEDQEAYVKFFKSALKKFGVNSPAELDDDKKKEFFNYVDKNYTAKGEDVKEHNCATHVEHPVFGAGETVSGQHTLVQEGEQWVVTHYDVEFEHGIEEMVSVQELAITQQESHAHAMAKKAGRKKIKANWSKKEQSRIDGRQKNFREKMIKLGYIKGPR